MAGLARIAKEKGLKVTGCDAKIYPPMSDQLRDMGIEPVEGFEADRESLKADLFIIGNVAKRGMPILEAILEKKLPYDSGPHWLYENVLREKQVLAVAGTHGKTTTSAMLTWILEHSGRNPSFLVGGLLENFGASSRLLQPIKPDNQFFVIEADEYDTAFFDKRSKFVHYHPDVLVMNNIEYDHADIFENVEAIKREFNHVVRTMRMGSSIVANGSDSNVKDVLAKEVYSDVVTFNSPNSYHDRNYDPRKGTFEIWRGGKMIAECPFHLKGEHNRRNMLAAFLAAQCVGVTIEESIAAMEEFQNVKRRMELKKWDDSFALYDDFAHHPTAIKTTIQGLREESDPGDEIIAVLEPRSNTMKMGVMRSLLADSLVDADKVFCYSGGVDWRVDEALSPLGEKCVVEANFGKLLEKIAREATERAERLREKAQNGANPGKVRILVMSNGSFMGIHGKIWDLISMENGKD